MPLESTPLAMRMPYCLSPVRYYMEVALGVLLKGVGMDLSWPQLTTLAATTGALGAWSIARLKRHLYA